MATQITNQATLNYNSGTETHSASSNIATVTMQGPLDVRKHALQTGYKIGDEITYDVFVENSSANALTNITIVDDLGTYTTTTAATVTPLTYVGPAKLFINNVFSTLVVPTVTNNSVTFMVTSLPAGSHLLLQYVAKVNEYAGATIGTSTIDNTVSVTATGVTTPITADTSIPVASYANVTIEKTMSPASIVAGNTLTYTFLIRNYGTIAATDVVLIDTLNTEPDITSVTVDGVTLDITDYDYNLGIFRHPATAATTSYSVPAATFTQDAATGITTVTPGTSTVVIQGTI